jgi:hypothetical protein
LLVATSWFCNIAREHRCGRDQLGAVIDDQIVVKVPGVVDAVCDLVALSVNLVRLGTVTSFPRTMILPLVKETLRESETFSASALHGQVMNFEQKAEEVF